MDMAGEMINRDYDEEGSIVVDEKINDDVKYSQKVIKDVESNGKDEDADGVFLDILGIRKRGGEQIMESFVEVTPGESGRKDGGRIGLRPFCRVVAGSSASPQAHEQECATSDYTEMYNDDEWPPLKPYSQMVSSSKLCRTMSLSLEATSQKGTSFEEQCILVPNEAVPSSDQATTEAPNGDDPEGSIKIPVFVNKKVMMKTRDPEVLDVENYAKLKKVEYRKRGNGMELAFHDGEWSMMRTGPGNGVSLLKNCNEKKKAKARRVRSIPRPSLPTATAKFSKLAMIRKEAKETEGLLHFQGPSSSSRRRSKNSVVQMARLFGWIGGNLWAIETIVDTKIVINEGRREISYKVKWDGWPESSNSWVTKADVHVSVTPKRSSSHLPDSEATDFGWIGGNLWAIETIVDTKIVINEGRREISYKVKWDGWPESSNSWVTDVDLYPGSKVKDYWRRFKKMTMILNKKMRRPVQQEEAKSSTYFFQ